MKKTLTSLAALCLLSASAVAIVASDNGARSLTDGKKLTAAEKAELTNHRAFPAVEMTPFDSEATVPLTAKVPTSYAETSPYGPQYDYNVADDNVNAWYFKLAGLNSGYYRGIVHITTDAPYDRHLVADWPRFPDSIWDSGEPILTAACMVGDEMWAYECGSEFGGLSQRPHGIIKVNMETGRQTGDYLYDDTERMHTNPNCVLYEMSYDPETEYVYALLKRASGWAGLDIEDRCDVVRIDPDRPQVGWELMGTIDYAYAMACDDGYMYLIQRIYEPSTDAQGNPTTTVAGCALRKLDLGSYASFAQSDLETVGRKVNMGFLDVAYYQTMEFDHSDHTLWWFGSKADNNGTRFFTRLNTETAETDDPLVTVDDVMSIVALCIPYEIVPEGAPHYVRNLAAIPAAEGAASAAFSWTNPSFDTRHQTISSLKEIQVWRDGALYKTLTDVAPGQQMTWSDEGQADGLHSYKFVAVNNKGAGLSRQRNIFIGHDVPAAVKNITIETDGASATIAWDAPVVGVNGGWIDKSSLVYDVLRMPDRKQVATGIAETTVSDEAQRYIGYTYQITARTADGTGATATSKNRPFGPNVDVPYHNDLLSESAANQLTIIDANGDGFDFAYGTSAFEVGVPLLWYGNSNGEADDWVILPPMNFDPAKQYKLLMRFAVSNYANCKEHFQVRQGTNNVVEKMTETIADWETPTGYGEYQDTVVYITDATKGNFIGIRLCSEAYQGWVVYRDFEIREYGKTDAALVDFDGPLYAYTGGENTYTVTVKNEGSANMRGAKAQLLSYPQGEVLAEASVPALRPGEVRDIDVKWQPSAAGTKNITARVYLNGDIYEDDNETDRYITVNIQAGEPSQWKQVLSKDQTGYRPFYVAYSSGQIETIYRAAEVGLEDITITGISYLYSAADSPNRQLESVPVEIYLGETDQQTSSVWSDMYGGGYVGSLMPDNIFTHCYSGNVNMAGKSARNEVAMMFFRPFYYDGTKNLVVRNILVNGGTVDFENNPNWYIFDEQLIDKSEYRSTYWTMGDNDLVKLNDQVPVIKLAYRTGNVVDAGVEGVITIGAGAVVRNGAICFDGVQDRIVVYNAAGAKVVETSNATSVKGLKPGIYLVQAREGMNVSATKVIIR